MKQLSDIFEYQDMMRCDYRDGEATPIYRRKHEHTTQAYRKIFTQHSHQYMHTHLQPLTSIFSVAFFLLYGTLKRAR